MSAPFTPSGVPTPVPPPISFAAPYHAAAWLSKLRQIPDRRRYEEGLTRLRRPEGDTLKLNLGRAPQPEGRVIIGGAVKLLALKERFGEWEDFNVLYLVSSALPPFAESLVRAAKARGIKIVWNQNGIAYPGWCGWKYPWFNEPMARLLPLADYVVYQSEFCRRSATYFLGSEAKGYEILFNPVDTALFAPVPRPVSDWRLLAAGTSHNFYRTKSAIDCLATLIQRGRPAHLTITGEMKWSGGEAEVKNYVQAQGLTPAITFRPAFTRDQAPDVYCDAHILLHPKDKDPCPTVPIEAMSCGLPVVGSRSGGMPELVPATCGRLIEVEESWITDHAPNPVRMADGVEEIMADYAGFSQAAREHAVSSFDEKLWLDRHAEIFERVLNAR